jgi:hypothetical protein
MKRIIAFTVLSLMVTSCNLKANEADEVSNEPVVIGSVTMEDGSSNPVLVGETKNEQIWLDYIKAHNDRDLDKIAAVNAEDWEGYTPDGGVIKGNDKHIEFLASWFESSSPKWKVNWMIANAAADEDGVMTQWLTTGNEYTNTDEDGNEVLEYHVHDIQFVGDNIKKINVYSRMKPAE